MTTIEVIRVDYDNSEDDATVAIQISPLGRFSDTEFITGIVYAEDFISTIEPVTPYLGNNGEIYPQFKIKRHTEE